MSKFINRISKIHRFNSSNFFKNELNESSIEIIKKDK